MHAAFADDAIEMVKQIVKRIPSFLGMNVAIRLADWSTALHAGSPALHLEHHPRHRGAAVGPRPATPSARTAGPRASPTLSVENSTSRLASFARKSAAPRMCNGKD